MFMVGSFLGGLGEGIESGYKFGDQLQQDIARRKMAADADAEAAKRKAGGGATEPEPRVIDTGAKPPSATSGTGYDPNDPKNADIPPAPPPGQKVTVLSTGLTPKSPIPMKPQALLPPGGANAVIDPNAATDASAGVRPREASAATDASAGIMKPVGVATMGPHPTREASAATDASAGIRAPAPWDAQYDASAGFARPLTSGTYQAAPEGYYQALPLGGYQAAPEGSVGQNLIGGAPRPQTQWRGQGGRANPYGGAISPPSSQFGGYGPFGPQYAGPATAFQRQLALPPSRTRQPPRQPFVDALGNPLYYDTNGNPTSGYY